MTNKSSQQGAKPAKVKYVKIEGVSVRKDWAWSKIRNRELHDTLKAGKGLHHGNVAYKALHYAVWLAERDGIDLSAALDGYGDHHKIVTTTDFATIGAPIAVVFFRPAEREERAFDKKTRTYVTTKPAIPETIVARIEIPNHSFVAELVDTSDIPEADEAFFQSATLRQSCEGSACP